MPSFRRVARQRSLTSLSQYKEVYPNVLSASEAERKKGITFECTLVSDLASARNRCEVFFCLVLIVLTSGRISYFRGLPSLKCCG